VASRGAGRLRLASESQRVPLVPNGVMGMLIFVICETMLFAGMISAFTILRSAALVWPPPDQPRLPAGETALNTAALLASGVCLFLAQRTFARDRRRARRPLLAAMLLGAFFVGFQGVEWVRLIGQGLTLTSSTLGSFFYLIVGMHALHAVAAIVALAVAWRALLAGRLTRSWLGAVQIFWYFVVLIWPLLYWKVYL
jgi:cytochrome c oxidase subunit 3